MMRDNEILDSRLITRPSLQWLHNWFSHQKVLKRNDRAYVIYSKLDQLYSSDQIFMLYIDDFTMVSDMESIEKIILTSWNESFNAVAKFNLKTDPFTGN